MPEPLADPLSFTSKEVIAIINGGCLCTIGRGTCQLHATSDPTANDDTTTDQSRPLIPGHLADLEVRE